MDFYWVYDLPNWLFATLLCAIFSAFSVGGLVIFRPWVRRIFGPPPGSNDVVSYILSAAGVFYGITLGLIAVGAWSDFADADAKVSRETASLGALYRDVSCLPEPGRTQLQDTLRRYTRYVIDDAWPQHKKGIIPAGGEAYIDEFLARFSQVVPTDEIQKVFVAEAFTQFNTMLDCRRERLESVTQGLPEVLWLVVFAGGLINIALVWCFVMDRLAAHVLLMVLLAVLIALLIFLTAAMDNPFRGSISVGPESFELAYQQLMAPK